MTDYESVSECISDFPKINARKLENEVNELFKPYLFFRRSKGKIELYCSACRHEGSMENPPRTITSVEMDLMYGRHNDNVSCPYCGKKAIYKEICHLGQKKKLLEYHPVVILKAKGNAIYARAYWARKNYMEGLCAPPKFRLAGAYIFRPGEASEICEDYYGKLKMRTRSGRYSPKSTLAEPFVVGSGCFLSYTSYTVFGMEELRRSFLKYCDFSDWERDTEHMNLMKAFTLASIYPRQFEMLQKCGFGKLCYEAVYWRMNSKLFDWNATEPKKAWKLSKTERRLALDMGFSTTALTDYVYFRNIGKQPDSLEDFLELYGKFSSSSSKLRGPCRKYGLRLSELDGYLTKQVQGGKNHTEYFYLNQWLDYVSMAEALGWDLGERSVLLPRELIKKHDEANLEHLLLLERQKIGAEREAERKAQKSLERRDEKYNFSLGGYTVRIAMTAEEIRAEGKSLCHCVGGYAERHLQDKLTILFLRSDKAPNTSLYTIEMWGNDLRQIHGYKNDAGAESPQKTMDWFLSEWLSWLKAGSKRNKDGTPKLKKGKSEAA